MFVGRVILMEKSDLEAERVALFESVIQNQRSMKEFESNLLHKLSSIQVIYNIYLEFIRFRDSFTNLLF